MNQLLSDNDAWGQNGWMDQKVQVRLLEVAQTRAYGQQTFVESKKPVDVIDAGSTLRQIYDEIKADGSLPELRYARKATDVN